MKDILEMILKYIPAYLDEFLALLSAPKTFIASRNRDNLNNNFINALAFLGITICLFWLLKAPLIEKDDFFSNFFSTLIIVLIIVVLYSGALRLSWKIVGGKAPLKSFMITYAYYSGIMVFFIAIFSIVGYGIIKTFSPELYEVLLTKDLRAIVDASPFSDTWFVVGFCVSAAGFILSSIWGLVGWGAYRQLNALTKKSSVFALFLTGIFSLPVEAIAYFLGKATN